MLLDIDCFIPTDILKLIDLFNVFENFFRLQNVCMSTFPKGEVEETIGERSKVAYSALGTRLIDCPVGLLTHGQTAPRRAGRPTEFDIGF